MKNQNIQMMIFLMNHLPTLTLSVFLDLHQGVCVFKWSEKDDKVLNILFSSLAFYLLFLVVSVRKFIQIYFSKNHPYLSIYLVRLGFMAYQPL